MSQYREGFYDLLPSWLSTGDGELVAYSLNVLLDWARERVRLGLLARFPDYAPADALGAIGRDRKIIRGIDEPAASYAVRLKRWLDDHLVRGNPWALLEQLRAYCNAPVMVRIVDRRGNWHSIAADGTRSRSMRTANWLWDTAPASPRWARFWVIIYPTAAGEPWAASEAGAWPSGGTIGTTATPEQVASVRQIVREWKPAGTRCEWIIVAFDPVSFDPAAPEPDGTWEWFGRDNAGSYEQARLDTARYWKGTA